MPYKLNRWLNQLLLVGYQSGFLSRNGHNNRLLPKESFSDDTYIISYPKSGNTWLRFLIGNVLTENSCDFTNIHKIVPDLHKNRDECSHLKRPRLMKIHIPYSAECRRVIYMVRDGRDVAVSYYFHLIKKRLLDPSTRFENYLHDFNKGLINPVFGSWSSHTLSWLNHWSDNCLLVSYERLINDTESEFKRILDFININKNQSDISTAIAASDFNKMKTLEEEQSAQYHDFAGTNLSIPFMRAGKPGGWRDHFSEQMEQDFILRNGEALRRLNYLT